MPGDPQTTGILASLIGLFGLMLNREIRELRDRRNGHGRGTQPPLSCALAKERDDVNKAELAKINTALVALGDLAKGSFVPSHVALAKNMENQEKYLREIRDATRDTANAVDRITSK